MNGNNNSVNHPTHYNMGKIEVIDAIEDLFKALWYIRRELNRRGVKV